MNRPKDTRLLVVLAAASLALGVAAAWSLADWGRDLRGAPDGSPSAGSPS